jgi:hypothetical protein
MPKNIKITDIDDSLKGFSCEKIKRLNDSQLLKFEDKLNEKLKISTLYANIDDLGFLTVQYNQIHGDLTDSEKEIIVEILKSL